MESVPESPPRFRTAEDVRRRVPLHVVWELTLACDLKCAHCGSRAGRRRKQELNTREVLEVIDAFARLGTREVSLIGGEAYLRDDLPEIISAIRSHGIYCAIQTGGRNFTPARMRRAIDAGLNGIGVSLDGLEILHDRLRGVKGSFRAALATLRRAKDAGLRTSVSTQIGSKTAGDLSGLFEVISQAGAQQWQVQLTVPIGNAADHDELLLQPWELIHVMPVLADLYVKGLERGVLLLAGNNIGYFGPYERLWRGYADEREHWKGCTAGINVLALESDGTVKGCPSLPTARFASGNVRDLSLEQIWRSEKPRARSAAGSFEQLWGFCRHCYYAADCMGGCTWMADALFGRAGNNPYCHFRALELAKAGLRERVVPTQAAAALPFATGRFALVLERTETKEIVQITPAPSALLNLDVATAAQNSTRAPGLHLCGACETYIRDEELVCPHCGSEATQAAHSHMEDHRRRRELMAEVSRLIATHQGGAG